MQEQCDESQSRSEGHIPDQDPMSPQASEYVAQALQDASEGYLGSVDDPDLDSIGRVFLYVSQSRLHHHI